jgi:hypothetical protein
MIPYLFGAFHKTFLHPRNAELYDRKSTRFITANGT